jgi:glycosyltransferase involved in cell wall biosynthesis
MAKILIHCSEVIGTTMAGPAIRCWELAKALSKHHDVTLSIPNASNTPEISPKTFTVVSRTLTPLKRLLPASDVLITQLLPRQIAWHAKRHGVRILIDAYDPMPLENLELFQSSPTWLQTYKNTRIVNNMCFAFDMADGILCANSKQRDLWMGMLMALGKITPEAYNADKTLKNLVAIVPFGLPSAPPVKSGDGLRKMFNLNENDKVLLWGGGIWNWFDPLSLIKAVKQLAEENFPVKLVFMGVKHPNPAVPEMQMASDAMQLAKELDLLDKDVFFNYGWIPYEQRQNFLLEADIGVSIHSEHLETQYAFRTRILDYIWVGLPILSTTGDSFAELIQARQLGRVVPYGDVQAIAKGIRFLLEPEVKERMQENLHKIRSEYYWESTILPIENMIAQFAAQSKSSLSIKDIWKIMVACCAAYSPRAILNELTIRAIKKL